MRNKKVLILDDNPINNNKYIIPVKEKYSVDVTFLMSSATRMLKSREYDIVVIDIMMPSQGLSNKDEMSAGFNYYQEVLRNLHLKCKILFWSRLTESCYDKTLYPNDGNFDFVHKSESRNHLLNKINAMLSV